MKQQPPLHSPGNPAVAIGNAGGDASSFAEQATATLRRLRVALSTVIDAIQSSIPIRTASDLERALDISNTLAWKVFKVAFAADPLAEAGNVPKPVAMERFLSAAARRGVPDERIQAAVSASEEFEKLVRVHASDRITFDSMISGVTDAGTEQIDLKHKRAAFRGNQHIFGVHARTQLTTCFLHPAQDAGQMDLATLRGPLELQRIRPNASWIVAATRAADDDGVIRRPIKREPLDLGAETTHGLSPLRAYCTRPLPKFRAISGRDGFVLGELVGNGVGTTSAISCITGEVVRSCTPCYRDQHNRDLRLAASVYTPSRVLIYDVLVLRGMFGPNAPDVYVCDDYWRGMRNGVTVSEVVTLTPRETLTYLGVGPSVLQTPDVPRYSEMAQFVFDRLGWDGEQFDVYRCRVEYPIMHSAVVVRFDLPEKPGAV